MEKIDENFIMPIIFLPLIKKYEYLNIEYIDGKAIEIHLRHNPDFVHGNSVAYPVWNDSHTFYEDKGLKYIEAPDFHRKGFWID